MTIAAPDLGYRWANTGNMATYPMTRLPYKHLLSSTSPFERCYSKRPTISHLNPFGSKYKVHIRGEEHPAGSKHLSPAREDIIDCYTSFPKVVQDFTLEDEYGFTTRD
jgi:hypothetical protein